MSSMPGGSNPCEVSPWGKAPRVLILGARGRMAGFICPLFEKAGCVVTGIDREERIDDTQLKSFDLIWVSVPMETVTAVIRDYAPRIHANALICDINSLKLEVAKIYEQHPCAWLSLHPMFGP